MEAKMDLYLSGGDDWLLLEGGDVEGGAAAAVAAAPQCRLRATAVASSALKIELPSVGVKTTNNYLRAVAVVA